MAYPDTEYPPGDATTQTGVFSERWVESDAVAGGYWYDLSRQLLPAHLDLSPADLDARLTLYAARATRGESVADGVPDPTATLSGVVCWCCGGWTPQCCRLVNVGWEVRTVWVDAYRMCQVMCRNCFHRWGWEGA